MKGKRVVGRGKPPVPTELQLPPPQKISSPSCTKMSLQTQSDHFFWRGHRQRVDPPLLPDAAGCHLQPSREAKPPLWPFRSAANWDCASSAVRCVLARLSHSDDGVAGEHRGAAHFRPPASYSERSGSLQRNPNPLQSTRVVGEMMRISVGSFKRP